MKVMRAKLQGWRGGWAGLALLGGMMTAQGQENLYIADQNQVDLYNGSTGAVIQSNFVSVTGATSVAVGPGNVLYVGTSDDFTYGAAVFEYNATTGAMIGSGPLVSHESDPLLDSVQGLAITGGNLYVADTGSNKVWTYDSSGNPLGAISDPEAMLTGPYGMNFDSLSGNLYIANLGGGNILGYNVGGASMSLVFPLPPYASAPINGPSDVAVGPDGFLYVVDISGSTEGLYKVNPTDGTYVEMANYATDPNFEVAFAGVALGPDGRVYVTGSNSTTGMGQVNSYSTDALHPDPQIFIDGSLSGLSDNAGFMAFATVPEPGVWGLAAGALGAGAVVWRRGRRAGV